MKTILLKEFKVGGTTVYVYSNDLVIIKDATGSSVSISKEDLLEVTETL